MKKYVTLIILFCFSVSAAGQINDSIAKQLNKQLDKNLEAMLKKAFYPKYDMSPCLPSDFYKSIDKQKIFVGNTFSNLVWKQLELVLKMPNLKGTYDKGFYKTLEDKALDLADKNNKGSDFIKAFTGKELGEVNAQDQKILRDHFEGIKKMDLDAFLGNNKFTSGNCSVDAITFISLEKAKLGSVQWNYRTNIYVDCNCGASATQQDLKRATYNVTASSKGRLSYTSVTLGVVEKSTLDILNAVCCGKAKEEKDEGSWRPINDHGKNTHPVPLQTIGGTIGVGFEQDLEEVTLCLGAEYLFNATSIGTNPLYVGANATFSTTSFMDFSTTWVSVGPTTQLFTPITPSEEVHMTNGVSVDYIFGANDSGGVKDNISGFGITLNTGLNIQIKENFAISLIVPVVTHQNLTFEAEEGGGSNKVSDTSILLNKNNPIKIGLRIGF